jgi:putative transcriptional regulator
MASGAKIISGLEDALAHARGQSSRARVSEVAVPKQMDVAGIRRNLGMSQEEFALCFGFSVGTVRNWEQGHRHPDGPSRVLLLLIQRIPDEVKEALRNAA